MPGWRLERGALPVERGVRFSVWAPRAERVSVLLLGGPGSPSERELQPRSGGVFETAVAGAGPGTDYLFRLDGALDRPDPASRQQPAGVHGASRVVDPEGFAWSDAGWTGLATPELVLYELHVGTFTGAGTFDAAAGRLPYLRELGITMVELMPVAEFPGGRNWGYDGVFPYAPQSTYGGPEGLRRFVDAAHRTGLGVALDVVYNHLGPEGNVLPEFGPYLTDRYRTPWGEAVNFDGPDSDEVRRYFVDNALYWISEFHVDALRLDAVHAIFDFGAHHILAEIAEAAHALAGRLRRRVQVIAESDLNDPRLVRRPERGGYGLDAQWSDDFHHAIHVALTGERGGYYADFGGVAPVAKALRDRFVYDGRRSAYRRRRHGAPATDLPADRFVVAVQNHDQVGNRARGDRLSTLVCFERQKLAAALLLLSPYVPLLFMGEEYGETNPFLYFVSHGDPVLVEAVRDGRRRDFAGFAWEGEIPDPQAEETFLRSKPRPERAEEPGHAELLRLHRDVLRIRRGEPALRPGAAAIDVSSDPDAGWVAVRLDPPGGGALLAAFQLEALAAQALIPAGPATSWRLRLTTDDVAYGGPGPRTPEVAPVEADGAVRLSIPPLTAVLYGGGR